jgi:hypothetical protein
VGIDVPLYTMTGWGPAQVPQDEVIPLFGGYPDAFWDRQVDGWSRGSLKHYFFSLLRDDNTIGEDLNRAENVSDLAYLERYPFATCEVGGGMQVSYHHRPILPDDVVVLRWQWAATTCQAIISRWFPSLGQLSTLQDQATGYWNVCR